MYRTVAQLPLSSEIGPFEVGGSSSKSGNTVESQYLAFGNKVQLPLLELGPPNFKWTYLWAQRELCDRTVHGRARRDLLVMVESLLDSFGDLFSNASKSSTFFVLFASDRIPIPDISCVLVRSPPKPWMEYRLRTFQSHLTQLRFIYFYLRTKYPFAHDKNFVSFDDVYFAAV